MRNIFLWVGLALVVTAALLLVGADMIFGLDDGRGTDIAGLVTALALAIVIGGGVFSSYRGHLSQAAIHILIWIAIAIAFALLYRWRMPLSEFFGMG